MDPRLTSALISKLVNEELERRLHESPPPLPRTDLPLQTQQFTQLSELQQQQLVHTQRLLDLGSNNLPSTPTLPRSNSALSTTTLPRSNSVSSTSSTTTLPRSNSFPRESSSCSTPPSDTSPKDCPRLPKKKRMRRSRLEDFYPDEEEDDEESEQQFETFKRFQTLAHDRSVILYPMLEFFDAKWLAPKNSLLFSRNFRKEKTADGFKVLAKREQLNIPLFNKLVRIALRRIMGDAYTHDRNLAFRYRLAAKKIITKRRANHKQSWRKKNTHKALIYGTGTGTGRTPSHANVRPNKRRRRRRYRVRGDNHDAGPDTTSKLPTPVGNADGADDNDGTGPDTTSKLPAPAGNAGAHPDTTSKLPTPVGNAEAHPDTTSKLPTPAGNADDDDTDIYVDEEKETTPKKNLMQMLDDMDADFSSDMDEESQYMEEEEKSGAGTAQPSHVTPPVSDMTNIKTCCVQCSKRLEFRSCFPQENADWAPNLQRPVRCGDCWDKHVQGKMMPEMQERINAQQNKLNKAGTPKKRKRTHCKCGSTTHLATTALDCPLNKRNLRKGVQPVDKSEMQEIPKKRKRKRRTRCKCGSTTHLTARAKDCPLNKRNSRKGNLLQPADNPQPPAQPADKSQPPVQPADKSQPPAQPANKSQSPQSPTTRATNITTPSPPPPIKKKQSRRSNFDPQINDNVIAKWDHNAWYLSQVVDIKCVNEQKLFTVYCPVTAHENTVTRDELRKVDAAVRLPTRADLVKDAAEFTFSGAGDLAAGRWKVLRISKKNNYECIRLSGGDKNAKKKEFFDIGYVMEQVADETEEKRIRGPICRN